MTSGSSACCSDYALLLQQLQDNETSSGDSFYVRVNVSIPAGPGGTLVVCCNDILHVTNTRPTGSEDSWFASQVHPCQLLDLQSGNVPNYYRWAGFSVFLSVSSHCTLSPAVMTMMNDFRAQRLLIRAIEDMSFEAKSENVRTS